MRRREFITLLGGAAAAWPLAARAQQSSGKSHRVSFLALVPGEDTTLMKALLQRLHELGYSEGTNMIFEYRSAEGRPERLGPLAMELVQTKPDVLVAGFGTLAAKAAKAATTTIPVVFTTVGDPLGAGIIASLSRPGGNVTGLTDQARDVQGKRLQLLLELIPGKNDIAVRAHAAACPQLAKADGAYLCWRRPKLAQPPAAREPAGSPRGRYSGPPPYPSEPLTRTRGNQCERPGAG